MCKTKAERRGVKGVNDAIVAVWSLMEMELNKDKERKENKKGKCGGGANMGEVQLRGEREP